MATWRARAWVFFPVPAGPLSSSTEMTVPAARGVTFRSFCCGPGYIPLHPLYGRCKRQLVFTIDGAETADAAVPRRTSGCGRDHFVDLHRTPSLQTGSRRPLRRIGLGKTLRGHSWQMSGSMAGGIGQNACATLAVVGHRSSGLPASGRSVGPHDKVGIANWCAVSLGLPRKLLRLILTAYRLLRSRFPGRLRALTGVAAGVRH